MAKATKKSAKKVAAKKGPAQPMKATIEIVQKAKSISKDKLRAAIGRNYEPATVNAQMSRINNSPLLKVTEDTVTYKG